MNELASKECVPCRGGVPPLKGQEVTKLLSDLEGWEVVNEHHLRKEYKFKDFKESQAFVNRVGAIAEDQDHHPDVHLAWGKVRLEIWTHAVGGLTVNDFIVAARCDRAL